MSRTLPRRRLLAGALALPAAASAAALPALAAVNPDAALLDLGRQYDAAQARYQALFDQADAAEARACAAHPPKPEALRIREGDWYVGRRSEERAKLDAQGGYMDGEIVSRWRNGEANVVLLVPSRLDTFMARRAEILAAWDAWTEAKERVNVAHGVRALEAQADALGDTVGELEQQILETKAHTPAGWRLKARIVRRLFIEPDGSYEDRALYSLLADLTEQGVA